MCLPYKALVRAEPIVSAELQYFGTQSTMALIQNRDAIHTRKNLDKFESQIWQARQSCLPVGAYRRLAD